ncbi:MAG: hypothetical protein IJ702_04055 [Fretibacterium sp.]|nr:hypothetical protein [Fretibacterium sp.]
MSVAPGLSVSDAQDAPEEAGVDLPAGAESLTPFDMESVGNNRLNAEKNFCLPRCERL